MKIKYVAGGAFLLNTLLFGSYYAISKELLGRVDPIVFSFCEMMTLVPPALIILAKSWRHMTREAVKSGFILGSCLCLGLFMLSIALRYNSATGTAFFPALNGLLAALFAWLFLRQPITKATWFAGIVSVIGAFLLMANAGMGGIRGSLIAFLGGLFCTMYIFLADHFLVRAKKDLAEYWPLFAIELLTMALWGNLIALLFGDWNMVQFELPKDALIVLYIGLGTVFLPTLITVLLQKYISPVTISFISILEPLLGGLVAYLYLHEVLPLDGYLGGGLIIAGMLIHTWGLVASPTPTGQPALRKRFKLLGEQLHTSAIALLCYPLVCSGVGIYIVSRLGGFPPPAWRDLFQSIPHIPAMIQQGQATEVGIMITQSLSWLIAWSALLLMGGIATYRALEKLLAIAGLGKSLTTYTYHETKSASIGADSISDWQYQKYNHSLQDGMVAVLQYPTMDQEDEEIPTTPLPPSITKHSNGTIPNQSTSSKLTQDQAPQVDVRLLRQMGYTPYSVSPARSAKRKLDPVLLQQRRFQHKIRLAHVESAKVTGPLPEELPAAIEKQEMYSDTYGNSYFYWNEFSHSHKEGAYPLPEGQNDEAK